jgi:hypothetical protein
MELLDSYLFTFLCCFFCQEAIFRVVAAILHIGNIDFAKGKEVDSSVPKDDKSKFHLKTTAELLMYGSKCIIAQCPYEFQLLLR